MQPKKLYSGNIGWFVAEEQIREIIELGTIDINDKFDKFFAIVTDSYHPNLGMIIYFFDNLLKKLNTDFYCNDGFNHEWKEVYDINGNSLGHADILVSIDLILNAPKQLLDKFINTIAEKFELTVLTIEENKGYTIILNKDGDC